MKRYFVNPGDKINLRKRNPNDTSYFKGSKDEGKVQLLKLNDRLEALQEMLYAEHKHKILINTLESLNMIYPEPEEDLDGVVIPD